MPSREKAHAYILRWANQQIGAAQIDLLGIYPASGMRVALIDLVVNNVDGTTVAGDANEAFGRWSIVRGHAVSGAVGTAVTIRKANPDSPDPSFSARQLDTTVASGGTPETLHDDGFPTRTGILYRPRRIALLHARPDDSSIVVRLEAALPTPVRCSLSATVLEYEKGFFNFPREM
jgi:hypothetical protein